MFYNLSNNLSASPENCNIGYNNSWILVENDAQRKLFAQASYVTNFEDFTVSLSAGDITIGSVEIKDGNSNLKADVASANGYNALRVLSQDLESDIDDITIGDRNKNYATVNSSTSALNVHITNSSGMPISYSDSPNLDAFGRLRVSSPRNLFETKNLYNKGKYFINEISNGGNSVFNNNDSSLSLNITNSNGYVIRQTNNRIFYQPGKSQLALFTGILNPETNTIKRMGLFTSLSSVPYNQNLNGIYFEASNGTVSWVCNNDSNLVPTQSATQANWNIDKMDGTGPSGINLDFSKSQIFVIDFEWLGVGRIRFGFNVNGITYYCHQILNANNINGVYLKSPNLPIRSEIRAINGASTGTMKIICASVMSEGGSDPSYISRSVGSPKLNISANNRKAIVGVRLQYNRIDSINKIIDIACMCIAKSASSTSPYKYELVSRPTLNNSVLWSPVADSNFEYAVGNGTLEANGGIILSSGFGSVNSVIGLNSQEYEKISSLGCSINGIRDEIWLVITPLTENDGVLGTITFVEED